MNIWTERRTIVAYALSLLALAEIIDLTIVSVAIPNLMGALGANITDISLTMTSYIVAAAICIPLTGLMTTKYGMRNVALASVFVFGISSILCGIATNLQEMIIFRLIQGVGGAFLPALAQAYVVKSYTEQEQPKIMSVLTICIVLGPIIGPIMGGFIVQNMSWRWIFYVNVPICATAFILISLFMDRTIKKDIKIDFISFAFMAIGIGCLEYFVDEGNTNSWFESFEMICFLTTSVIFIGFFIWRGLLGSCVISLKVFTNPNFVLSCLLLLSFFSLVSGCLTYFSSMLQEAYGIPVDTAGYLQASRGITAIIGAPIYLKLSKKIDARILMVSGMLITAIAILGISTMSPAPNYILIVALVTFQGFGMIGVFVLLMSTAYIGVPENESSNYSGIYNFFRNFSSSIGSAMAATIIARQQQVIWNDLSGKISYYATGFVSGMNSLLNNLSIDKKIQLSAQLVQKSAILQSYLDMYHFAGTGILLIAWMPLLLKRLDPNTKPPAGH